jgi:2-C-methyl-D-erythritol 4-phosphate cytidylyltransferase
VVAGGATRFESVRNCLGRVTDEFDIVLIHDAARPFVRDGLIGASIRAAVVSGAAIAAVPESDTVKIAARGGARIEKTLDRRLLWRAQTPQTFSRALIQKAYARSDGSGVTDDASLVEMAGLSVSIVPGSYDNMKITTKEDLKMAEALIHR